MNVNSLFTRTVVADNNTFKDESGQPIQIRVSRFRSSAGAAHISLQVGATRIEFAKAGEYEMIAREVARMLKEVCDDPCTLPQDPA